MENRMPKLSLTFAAVLTMGLCFAQSGAYSQTAEDAPLAVEQPEAPQAAEKPGARVEVDDSGAGGLIEMPPDKCAEMPPDEGAEMPPDEGAEMPEMPSDEDAEM